MGNLLRMDLYRMNKAKSFRVCLIVTFLLALLSTPLNMALEALARMLAPNSIEETKMVYNLVDQIANPASSLGYMLCLLSAVMFPSLSVITLTAPLRTVVPAYIWRKT